MLTTIRSFTPSPDQQSNSIALLCWSGAVSLARRPTASASILTPPDLQHAPSLATLVSFLGKLARHRRLDREIYRGSPLLTSRDASLDALEVGASRRS